MSTTSQVGTRSPARLPWRAPDGDGGRLLGLDVARGIALLGMAATHVFAGREDDGSITGIHLVFSGRASALFAVLAGVSMALLTGRGEPLTGNRRWRASAGLALRAVLLAALGVALVALEVDIAVILTYYGVLFLVGLPFLGMRAPALAILGAVSVLALPLASYAVRNGLDLDPTFEQTELGRLRDTPGQVLEELALTGYYPVIPWLAYLLVGLAVGRLDLTDRIVAARLAVAGVSLAVAAHLVSAALVEAGRDDLLAVVTPRGDLSLQQELRNGSFGIVPTESTWLLVVDGPHTGTPLDLAATIGSSLAVIGGCLLLLHLGVTARTLLLPLAATGAMTLTLYSAHVWAVSEWERGEPGAMGSGAFYGLQLVVGMSAALAWRTTVGRGPLEAVLAAINRAVRGERSPSLAPPRPPVEVDPGDIDSDRGDPQPPPRTVG